MSVLTMAQGARSVGGGVTRPARPRATPRRRNCCWRLLPTRRTVFHWSLVIITITSILGFNLRFVEGITRMGTAAADVAEAAADLVGAGANATIKASVFGREVVATAANAASELWNGVDLINVSIKRVAVKSVGRSPSALQRWTRRHGPFPSMLIDWLEAHQGKLDADVGLLCFEEDWFLLNGSYWHIKSRLRLRRDGYAIGVAVGITATYELRWANLGWESLGFPPESQSGQLLDRRRDTMNKLPVVSSELLAVDDFTLKAEFDLDLPQSSGLYFYFLVVILTVCVVLATQRLARPLCQYLVLKLSIGIEFVSSFWSAACAGAQAARDYLLHWNVVPTEQGIAGWTVAG